MDTNKTTKEREEGEKVEVGSTEEKSAAKEKPACGCCGGKSKTQ